jgi:hypothetical protein
MSASRTAPKAFPRWARVVITVLVLLAGGALILSQLPRGAFPTDLSRIGQGQPVLVLARDISFVAGGEVMDLMTRIRPEYAGRVEFLVAHLGHPEGQAFARRFDARDGSVILFAGDGSLRLQLLAPQTADELRRALDTAFPR